MVCEINCGNDVEVEIEVLILVLMEYGLRVRIILRFMLRLICLNPCFNGIWSARVKSEKICI